MEPRDGDIVVTRAATADHRSQAHRYALVEWGRFKLVSERLSDLPHAEAVIEARLCASERGRDPWDSTGATMRRIHRLPLVYRSDSNTYTISVDVTNYSEPRATLQWQSTTQLSEDQVRAAIEGTGVPRNLAQALIGRAPMPDACR